MKVPWRRLKERFEGARGERIAIRTLGVVSVAYLIVGHSGFGRNGFALFAAVIIGIWIATSWQERERQLRDEILSECARLRNAEGTTSAALAPNPACAVVAIPPPEVAKVLQPLTVLGGSYAVLRLAREDHPRFMLRSPEGNLFALHPMSKSPMHLQAQPLNESASFENPLDKVEFFEWGDDVRIYKS